jgi:hypothetical protein
VENISYSGWNDAADVGVAYAGRVLALVNSACWLVCLCTEQLQRHLEQYSAADSAAFHG